MHATTQLAISAHEELLRVERLLEVKQKAHLLAVRNMARQAPEEDMRIYYQATATHIAKDEEIRIRKRL